MTVERLRNRDLRALIAGAQALEDIVDSAGFFAAILPLLNQLVRSDITSFNIVDLAAQSSEVPIIDPPDAFFESAEDVLGVYGHQNPLITAHRSDAIKFSDYMTRRELHRLDIYHLIYARISIEYQMAFRVPAPEGKVFGFALSRSRSDYSERDRAVINAFRPFVEHAYARVVAPPQPLPPEVLGLTQRQSEVLSHLSRGRSNLQIAQAMEISERTVHKHLENIYERLDVPSRSAAVARGLGIS